MTARSETLQSRGSDSKTPPRWVSLRLEGFVSRQSPGLAPVCQHGDLLTRQRLASGHLHVFMGSLSAVCPDMHKEPLVSI